MTKLLQPFVQELAHVQDEKELRLRFMDAAGELFHVQHWGISLRHEEAGGESIDLQGLPDRFVDYYRSFGNAIDPLRHYVINYHAPVHEQVLFTEESWKRSALYVQGCGRQYDHEHAMTGPIVGRGQLVGTVHFARTSGKPAFNASDLAKRARLVCPSVRNLSNITRSTTEVDF